MLSSNIHSNTFYCKSFFALIFKIVYYFYYHIKLVQNCSRLITNMNRLLNIFLLLLINTLYVNGSLNICLKKKTLKSDNPNLNRNDNGSIFQPDFEIKFDHPALSLDADFKNLTIWNLESTPPAYLTNDQLINVTFPNISIVGDYYNMTGNVGKLFDIFGQGDFWCYLHDFSISFSILAINLNTTDICVPVSLDVDLQKIEIQFNNLMNDTSPDGLGTLFNKAFCTIIPEIVRGVWQEVKEGNDARIEEEINKIINALLWSNIQLRGVIHNYLEEKILKLESLV